MAVPVALSARRKALEQEFPIDPPAATPAVPAAAPAAPAAAEPVDLDESIFGDTPATVVTESAPASTEDWQQKYKSLAGTMKTRDREIADLHDQVKVMRDAIKDVQVAKPVAPAPAAPAPQQVVELDPATKERFRESLPVIQAVAQQIAMQMVAPLTEKIAALEAGVGRAGDGIQATRAEIQQAAAQAQKQSFQGMLQAQVPDLATISRDPSFREFIDKTAVPYSPGVMLRARLKAAHENQDVKAIVSIIDAFRASRSGASASPAPGAFMQPTTGAGGALAPSSANTPGEATGVLPWSAREAAGAAFKVKKIAAGEYEKIRALYDRAAAEGRIDYSA